MALLLIPILQCGSVPSVCLSRFYHIRAFRHIERPTWCFRQVHRMQQTSPQLWFHSSRLYYANSVLYGSPSRCSTRFQRIQNSVASIVLQQPSLSSRVTLRQLHWLPVKYWIQLKLASLTYSLNTGTPSCV